MAQTIFEQGNVNDTVNIVDNNPPTVMDTVLSAIATSVKEGKVKGIESTPTIHIDSPGKVLAIATSQVEKKSVTEISPTELMMMATQKPLKEGSADKGIIDKSIIVLHKLIPDCQIENEASPSIKLKALT